MCCLGMGLANPAWQLVSIPEVRIRIGTEGAVLGWDSDFGMLACHFSRQEPDLTFMNHNQNKIVIIQVITVRNWDINVRNLDTTDINQVINVFSTCLQCPQRV